MSVRCGIPAADWFGDVEVRASECPDRGVGLVLHPVAERVSALELAGWVAAEMVIASRGVDPDEMRSATDRISSSIRASSCLPPLVRLFEIYLGPQEVARGERVSVSPNRILGRCPREKLVGQEGREAVISSSGIRRAPIEVLADRVRQLAVSGCCARREGGEETVRGGAPPALSYSGIHLPTRHDVSARRCSR